MQYFTVFTPTYNRAYILPKLYNSLINQTNKNFNWLIIDDGSTDNTKQLIDNYIKENKVSITYIRQENQGKHIAINKALDIIKTEYFITVDSDDHLLQNAIEKCYMIAEEIASKEKIGGFTFYNYQGFEDINLEKYGNQKTYTSNSIHFDIKGEKSFVLNTKIAKQFKFPIFENEKFCQEAYMLVQILDNYDILFTNYILARGEYLEDGLSQNIYRRFIENPNYSFANLKVKYNSKQYNEAQKRQFAINYWDIAIKSKERNIFKLLTGFPIKGLFIYLNYRFNKK